MGLLDYVADRSFRDDRAGRVVIFGGDLRKRGYLVRSKDDELKIRSFIKMFFFAQLSIQSLGIFLVIEWSTELNGVLGRPALHLVRTICVYLGTYSLVLLLPLLLLWRIYKKERLSFVSAEDEVVVTSGPSKDQRSFQVAALVAIGVLILMGVLLLLVRAK
ncbi:MAG: hypothetical protein ABSH13_09520 [Candidatus Acidiferrum sp.]|jgi:hypothetical protein